MTRHSGKGSGRRTRPVARASTITDLADRAYENLNPKAALHAYIFNFKISKWWRSIKRNGRTSDKAEARTPGLAFPPCCFLLLLPLGEGEEERDDDDEEEEEEDDDDEDDDDDEEDEDDEECFLFFLLYPGDFLVFFFDLLELA